MSHERFTDRIIKYLASGRYRPQKTRALARTLGIAEEEYGDFHDAVKALMHTGRVVMGSASALMLPEPAGTLVGQFRRNPRGFGFVIPDEPNAHGDLYIGADDTAGALTGDTVRAKVTKRGKRDGRMIYEGRIVDIVQRGHSQFVGELQQESGRWFVRPDGNIVHVPIFVSDVSAKGARAGDQVVVEITEYPQPMRDARGVIIEVLGRRGDPGVDTRSIIRQYGLPEAFDERVLEEARRVSREFDPQRAAAGREDLRGRTVITIDPVNARDFDDAISLEARGDEFELGVHIADVSHFVRPDSALDSEARARANSVYFPLHVVPMLPELLSNGVCSLQEGVPRLTKSAFITYDREGRVRRTRFANSVIASTKRLAYEEASRILEGKVGGCPRPVVELLKQMDALARMIRARRLSEGMIVLDLPQVELVFDELARVTGVVPEDVSFSHTIIEMFMVEANEAVARLFVELGVPHLRRVHEEPDDAAQEALARFLKALGKKVPKRIERSWLQKLLGDAKGAPEAFAIHMAALRSMQRAEYRPDLIGHYALASEDYLHFTSPIRRYPDLVDHRLLDAYLAGKFDHKKRRRTESPTFEELHELGVHCSTLERRAEAAERELKLVKILQLLEGRVGDHFDGVVTGVAQFGVFVQLREYLVDGLLRYADMTDDWWNVNSDGGFAIGERTGRRLAIGQQVRVAIARIDIPDRMLDLALADDASSRAKASDSSVSRRRKPRKGQRERSAGGRSRRAKAGRRGRR